MQILPLLTSIDPGKDKQVERLFDGPRRKIIQITLRNGAVLSAHKASVPITIQCIAGAGVLSAGDARTDLTPGTLVTIEPDVIHEVTALPAVSILVTQFTGE